MGTRAIAFGVLITLLGFSPAAISQPATAPLIPLEPEKPIDASRDTLRTAPDEQPSIEASPIEASPIEEELPRPSFTRPTPSTDNPPAPIEVAPDEPEESTDESRELEPPDEDAPDEPLDEREEGDLETPDSEPADSQVDTPDRITESALPIPLNCEPLPLVGGQGSEVTKRTSPPGFSLPLPLPGPIPDPRFRSNWNTDWYIPNANDFRRYVVVLMPHNNADYSIQMYLKYPDNTAEEFYEEQDIRLTANEPLIVETEPRSDLPPYQINANIGGILSIGVRYTIAVAGCR